MQMIEITVAVARLIALPGYENVKFDAMVKATIEEGDDPNEVYETCLAFCKEKIGKELDRFYPKQKPVTVVTSTPTAKASREPETTEKKSRF